MLTHEDVQDILRLVDDLQVDRLHLRLNKFELTLRRGDDGEWTQSARTLAEPILVDAEPQQGGPTPTRPEHRGTAGRLAGGVGKHSHLAAVAAAPETAPAAGREGLVEVRTSLPGTFYRAPKPGAPPFVEVGGEVTPTTVVGIVETMKLMNSVYAGVAGTVAEIRLRDGEFAEQGDVLMFVEPEPE